MVPAPDMLLKGRSTDSGCSSLKAMPDSRIMRMSSCVVITTSVLGSPSTLNSGRAASYFLAVQGITAT